MKKEHFTGLKGIETYFMDTERFRPKVRGFKRVGDEVVKPSVMRKSFERIVNEHEENVTNGETWILQLYQHG